MTGTATSSRTRRLSEDVKPLVPALTELQKTAIKAERQGDRTAKASIGHRPRSAGVAAFLRPMTASAAPAAPTIQANRPRHAQLPTPRACFRRGDRDKRAKRLSGRVAILPYIEQDNLYKFKPTNRGTANTT